MNIQYNETVEGRASGHSWMAGSNFSDGAYAEAQDNEAMQRLGQLTSEISHDFKNYLQVIGSTLELIENRAALGQTVEVVKHARRGLAMVDRGRALIGRMLDFSRPQASNPTRVDVNFVLTAILPLLRTAVGASVEVHLNLASDLLPAICDTRQLESALVNLAVNARDAMPTGGILAIETANAMLMGEFASLRPGWYASICVSDTGTGMAAETLERAFDPYFTTKPKGLGTGLGLSTTRAFACRFGGHVDASSAPGEGTSVRLYLPCAEGSAV